MAEHNGEMVVLVEVRSLMWTNQVIYPAGYRFVNCRFDNCTFVGRGGEFVDCEINNTLPEFDEDICKAMLAWREMDVGDVGYEPGTEHVRQMEAIYKAIRQHFEQRGTGNTPLSFYEQAIRHQNTND